AFLLALSCVTILPLHPAWEAHVSKDWTRYRVVNDDLWIPQNQSRLIDSVKKFAADNTSPAEPVLIAPHAPTLYCILQKPAPLWMAYFTWPVGKEIESKMIQSLESNKVRWALIADDAIDGRDDLRFRNAYPLLWQHILRNY